VAFRGIGVEHAETRRAVERRVDGELEELGRDRLRAHPVAHRPGVLERGDLEAVREQDLGRRRAKLVHILGRREHVHERSARLAVVLDRHGVREAEPDVHGPVAHTAGSGPAASASASS
jgi:hypothetical protein